MPTRRADVAGPLVARGDTVAFLSLYGTHAAATHALALRITGAPDAAEEAVLRAWLQAWRRAGLGGDATSARAGVLRLAADRALDLRTGRAPLKHPRRLRRGEDAPDEGCAKDVDEAGRAAWRAVPSAARDRLEAAVFSSERESVSPEDVAAALAAIGSREERAPACSHAADAAVLGFSGGLPLARREALEIHRASSCATCERHLVAGADAFTALAATLDPVPPRRVVRRLLSEEIAPPDS
jgi:DNA-directed RNA polymerase specialized sigma24 family protein